jgi:hypothetical protein
VRKKRMSLEPIEQAVAVLGEHFRHYVVIASDDESPLAYDVRFSDPYAAAGLLNSAVKYHENFISDGGAMDDDWEWSELDEDDLDDIDEY